MKRQEYSMRQCRWQNRTDNELVLKGLGLKKISKALRAFLLISLNAMRRLCRFCLVDLFRIEPKKY